MPIDFKAYTAENIRKVNAQRRALSQPDVYLVPTLKPAEVLFVPASKMGGEPATCYNCGRYNAGRSCMLIGPHVEIRKFIYPVQATADAKQIEYWPCCGEWARGEPNEGPEQFCDELDTPDELGLGWINAPKVGQSIGGANCGGPNGGDECDFYITDTADARDTKSGFCRVLQSDVEAAAVCAAWRDDDWVDYQRGSALLAELNNGKG
jgi:hypothetical protein